MSGYKDFITRQDEVTTPVAGAGEHADFDAAVAAAFAWVQQNNLRVINIETVFARPLSDRETDPQVQAMSAQVRAPFVRVWYSRQ